MKVVARILLLFILFMSVATAAWDNGNCGQDLVPDSVGAAQGHDSGSSSGDINDLCGHCGHLGSHLLGYFDNIQAAFPSLGHAWQGHPATVALKPSINFLFRPPRHFSVV